MASASGMYIETKACGWARGLPNGGGGVWGAAAQNVRPSRAVLSRSHALQQFSFCCIGNHGTSFLGGRRDATLRFETSTDGCHFFSAVAADSGGQLAQRRAQAVAKEASEMPDAEPARITGSTPKIEVKTCADCQHSKLLVDFEKTVTSMDGLTDVCRACLAVLRAKSRQGELHHLGMSLREAWERAKACKKCGLTKELRDFSRSFRRKDQTRSYCRACDCESSRKAALLRVAPTDQEQQCSVCGEVRAADHFSLNPKSRSGRQKICKSCAVQRNRQLRQIKRSTQIYLLRETKKCGACGELKQACEFHSYTGSLDGLHHDCMSFTRVNNKKRHKLRKLPKQTSTEQ